MKITKFLIFWTFTAVVIWISSLFFEYIINRSYIPEFTSFYMFGIICSIIMVTIWITYGSYLFKTITKLLNL